MSIYPEWSNIHIQINRAPLVTHFPTFFASTGRVSWLQVTRASTLDKVTEIIFAPTQAQ